MKYLESEMPYVSMKVIRKLLRHKILKWKSKSLSYYGRFWMGSLDATIGQNNKQCQSCLPMMKIYLKDQNKGLRKEIGMINRRDFILGNTCLVHNLGEIHYYLLSSHRQDSN